MSKDIEVFYRDENINDLLIYEKMVDFINN